MPRPPHEVEHYVATMYSIAETFASLAEDAPTPECFRPDPFARILDGYSDEPETPEERRRRKQRELEDLSARVAAEKYREAHNGRLAEARKLAEDLWCVSVLRPTKAAMQRLLDDTQQKAPLEIVEDFRCVCDDYRDLAKRWDREANRRSGRRFRPLRLVVANRAG